LRTKNTPHIHPRSAEFQTLVSGDRLRTGIFEENGARFITNDLYVGQATVFPQGSIHFQQNLGCDPAIFVAGFSNEDPGTVTIAQGFFGQLPPDTVSATLGELGVEEVGSIKAKIPANIAFGIEECVKRCKIDITIPFNFTQQVIKDSLQKQGILATIASGVGSSSSNVNGTSSLASSSGLSNLAESGSASEGGSSESNSDTEDLPFWENKYSKLVVILGAAALFFLICTIVASALAIRARSALKHTRVPVFSKAGGSAILNPYSGDKYADAGRMSTDSLRSRA